MDEKKTKSLSSVLMALIKEIGQSAAEETGWFSQIYMDHAKTMWIWLAAYAVGGLAIVFGGDLLRQQFLLSEKFNTILGTFGGAIILQLLSSLVNKIASAVGRMLTVTVSSGVSLIRDIATIPQQSGAQKSEEDDELQTEVQTSEYESEVLESTMKFGFGAWVVWVLLVFLPLLFEIICDVLSVVLLLIGTGNIWEILTGKKIKEVLGVVKNKAGM